jgi:hypothetical protein
VNWLNTALARHGQVRHGRNVLSSVALFEQHEDCYGLVGS